MITVSHVNSPEYWCAPSSHSMYSAVMFMNRSITAFSIRILISRVVGCCERMRAERA